MSTILAKVFSGQVAHLMDINEIKLSKEENIRALQVVMEHCMPRLITAIKTADGEENVVQWKEAANMFVLAAALKHSGISSPQEGCTLLSGYIV